MRSSAVAGFMRMREVGNYIRLAQARAYFSPSRLHLQGFEQIKARAGVTQKAIGDLRSSTADLDDALHTLQRKNKQLRMILQTLRWPLLQHFEANGIRYELPFPGQNKQPAPSSSMHSPASCLYLSGFFDGDGCVSSSSDRSGCTMSVNQSFDQANVLMLFFDTFGGSIARGARGLGLGKPMLQWRVYGANASLAASLLAPRSITKRKQLALATQWPIDRSFREDYEAKLVAWKRHDSAVPGACSWEYLAGFFDAEGCILLSSRWSLCLKITQKFPTVLRCIQSFLFQDLGINAHIYPTGPGWLLQVTGYSSSKQVLKSMLQAGLLCKAAQAELALGMDPQNVGQVRVGLSELKGNQHFGRKLDEAGRERARSIKSLRGTLGYLEHRGKLQQAKVLKAEVETLKQEHALLNARLENQQLLEYMRKLQGLHATSWVGP